MQTETITIDNIKHSLPHWLSSVMSCFVIIGFLVGMGSVFFAIIDIFFFKAMPLVLGDKEFELVMFARPAIFFFGGSLVLLIVAGISHTIDEQKHTDWVAVANGMIDSHKDMANESGFKVSSQMQSHSFVDRLFIDNKNNQIIAYIGPDAGVESNSLTVVRANYDEIKQVSVKVKPEEFDIRLDDSMNYILGGLLIGGVGGMVVGSLIESLIEGIRGSKKIYFLLDVNFTLIDESSFIFKGINNGFGVTSENKQEFMSFAQDIISKQKEYLRTISEYFKDKLSQERN